MAENEAELLMIPPDDLSAVGRAIFGHQWQTPMARALDISDRTVRRWAKDGAPAWIADPLRKMIDELDGKLRAADDILRHAST